MTKWTYFGFALAVAATFAPDPPSLLLAQKRVHLPHDLEGIRHGEDVGLPPCSPAIRTEVHRPGLGDEPPPHHVRLLAMATGGQPFGISRRGARLADLIEVAHEGQDRLPLALQIHQRLTRAQGCVAKPLETSPPNVRASPPPSLLAFKPAAEST